jgi:hypothetical protein
LTDQQHEAYIKALIYERAGYERIGDAERAEAVTAELRRLGHEASPPVKRATKRG